MATPIYGTENFATTLNVGGGINNSQTTGIVLTSVSGLNTSGGILGLTWASTIDTATYEEIEYGGVSGNELTGVTRGVAGTSAKAHSNGATVVSVVSSLHNNRLADKLRSVDAVAVQDPNGNEIIKTNYVTSAVNEIEVKNAATGANPQIAPTGGDTNIGINIKMKGTAYFVKPTVVHIPVFGPTSTCTTGDGKAVFEVPEELNGMNITAVGAYITGTNGTTGTMDIQIRNATDTQDILSTKITIDSTEASSRTAATSAVINTSYDDLATGDRLAFDFDAVHTTAALGCTVWFRAELP